MDKKSVWRSDLLKTTKILLFVFVVLALATAALTILCPVAVAEESGVDNKIVATDNTTDYAIANAAFGTVNYQEPRLLYGDVAKADYGKDTDPVSLTLKRNGTIISTFNRGSWNVYMNKSMPAGEYILTVSAKATATAKALTKDYKFAVTTVAFPADALNAVIDALSPKHSSTTFTFERTGQLQLVGQVAYDKIAALQAEVDKIVVRDGEWKSSKYDSLFEVRLIYNMDGMGCTNYVDEDHMHGEDTKPAEAGKYTIFYAVDGNNFNSMLNTELSIEKYEESRRVYTFDVIIKKAVEIPDVNFVYYTGNAQKADIRSTNEYTVENYEGFTDAGVYDIRLTLSNNDYYYWQGKELGDTYCVVKFEIKQAVNQWLEDPGVVSWVEGNYNAEENIFTGVAAFGTITYTLKNVEDETIIYYNEGVNDLAGLKAGVYKLEARVEGTDNYSGLHFNNNIVVFEKEGMPWWATTIIAVGAAAIVLIILVILWKKGVFQILTGRLVVAIRTQATIDATIAAVRANKVAEASKASRAAAEAKEKADALKQAREAERNKPAAERAAALEEKAAASAQRAERLKARAESMRNNASSGAKERAGKEESTDTTSTEE